MEASSETFLWLLRRKTLEVLVFFMCNIQPQHQQAMLKFVAFETLNLAQRVSIANFHCLLNKLLDWIQLNLNLVSNQARVALEAPSLWRLRRWRGTTSASSVTSAKTPWLARASSRSNLKEEMNKFSVKCKIRLGVQ